MFLMERVSLTYGHQRTTPRGANIWAIRISAREKKGKERKILEELMAKIFPNLKKTITHRSKKLKLIAHKNMKKTTPGHSIIKSLKSSHNRKNLKRSQG